MKIVIVGGGAAGLFAAMNIKKDTNEVIILEKNDEVGKKILVTGNGRCNLWNDDMDTSRYNSSNIELLYSFINEEIISETFTTLSKYYEYKNKNGYYYPYSNKAATVRDILLSECNKRGVEIITNYDVNTIKKDNESFIINDDIKCDKLIISTGGKSLEVTGSDGKMLDILKELGHDIVKPLPSLVPLYANELYLNKWNGIRCDATVTSIVDGERIKTEQGELQLTDYGLSGICIFNISRDIVKAIDEGKNASVEINFVNRDDIIDYLASKYENKTVYEILLKYFDKKLIKVLVDKMEINERAYFKSLTTKELSRLEKCLTRFSVNITGCGDFNKSQVTQGGVSLKEVNPDTFESNKINNLYLIGEVLDIDGICGGYNLGFAWMSALKVGKHIC